jgi:hypothetical protein
VADLEGRIEQQQQEREVDASEHEVPSRRTRTARNPCRPGQGCVRKWRSARQPHHKRWSRTDSRTVCDELPLAHARYGTVAG